MEIKFDEVDYNYKKVNYLEKQVLKNLSLCFKDGKINAIVGPLGSGKTTILELINMSIIPTKGKIQIGDITISSKEHVKNINNHNIGYVSQFSTDQFFDLTVRQELEITMQINNYKLNQINKRIKDVLLMVNLNQNKLDVSSKCLSHSESRKLSIAKALICNPKIIILDEPTVNLDSKTKNEFIKLIRLLKNRYNKTIIIVSNDIDFIHKISDYIFILHNKNVVLEGNKYDVFKDEKKLKKYDLLPPKVMLFSEKVLTKKNIKLGYRDEINDLIKDIYRSSY